MIGLFREAQKGRKADPKALRALFWGRFRKDKTIADISVGETTI